MLSTFARLSAAATLILGLGGAAASAQSPAPQAPAPTAASAQATTPALTDIDAFMERVLQRRDEAWQKLHDYILSETERFNLDGPGGVPLYGMKREYSWFVKEGFLVRSPVRFDGVTLNEEERRRYEGEWLEHERAREKRAEERKRARVKRAEPNIVPQADAAGAPNGDASLQEFVSQNGEPRFISEAYFMRFKFEPGNYYFVGKEKLDGRDVVRIEYYPKKLFSDDHQRRAAREAEAEKDGKPAQPGKKTYEVSVGSKGVKAGRVKEETPEQKARDKKKTDEEQYSDAEMERKFNKVAMVTLWVDPAEYQIVKYTFDNMDFGFLPGRWIVRVDEARASMTMARVLNGVWLPSEISMRAQLSIAAGPVSFQYGRKFTDYKKAEVAARVRSYEPREK